MALFVMVSPICHAQFDFTGGSDQSAPPAPAWTQFHLNPRVRVKLDFRNASVDAVAQILSQASGIPIVVDPTLTTGINLQSPVPQSLNDAFALFNASLDLKNADLTKVGSFLEIKVRQQSGRGGFGGGSGFSGIAAAFANRNSAQSSVLQVYSLQYADATDLAKVINDVYAPSTTSTANAVGGFPGFGGFGGGGGGGAAGGGRRGGANGVTGDTVKASADEFSNSVVINAPQRDQQEIGDIISSIDKPATQPQQTSVFKLQYAIAGDLETVVQNLLTNSTSFGRGGTSGTSSARPSNNGGGGGFFQRFGGGNNNSSNNANGTVSADTRTNTLVVTTNSQLMQQVQQVVLNLDKPATYEGSTFVYVLQNARADVVANLFNEALGNRTTNGPVGGALTSTGATQPTVTASTTSSSTTGTVPSTLGNASSNNGGNRNGQNQNTTSSSTQSLETQGLDELNHIVNIRNLTGQVLLVPNIDTNSIIVVSPPEDWGIVKGVLAQLDEQPQQVMIDTLIVEATLDKNNQLGVEFNVNQQNAFGGVHGLSNFSDTTLGSASTAGFNYTLTAAQYQLFLQAAETDTKLDVLSTPRIFTTNNATAQINISQSIPYVTNETSVATGTAANELVATYDFLDVGIVLTVTPRIMSNGFVTMDVSQTANELQGYQNLGNSTEAPIVNQREAETTVAVQDGKTIVLGGIIQNQLSDTVNKIPLLGDIPVLGGLFRSDTKMATKTELLVFLTPHVIKNSEDAQALKDETEQELGKEAHSLIPAAPPAPRSTSASAQAPVPAQTVVTTITPSNPNDVTNMPLPTVNAPESPTVTSPSRSSRTRHLRPDRLPRRSAARRLQHLRLTPAQLLPLGSKLPRTVGSRTLHSVRLF